MSEESKKRVADLEAALIRAGEEKAAQELRDLFHDFQEDIDRLTRRFVYVDKRMEHQGKQIVQGMRDYGEAEQKIMALMKDHVSVKQLIMQDHKIWEEFYPTLRAGLVLSLALSKSHHDPALLEHKLLIQNMLAGLDEDGNFIQPNKGDDE